MAIEHAERLESFVPLTSSDALDDLFERSNDRPVLLFKHSLTCPISSAAYDEMTKLSREVSLLVIQRSRGLSVEIERRTGVRHESPQVIILRNGAAVWNGSHWTITADTVERVAREND